MCADRPHRATGGERRYEGEPKAEAAVDENGEERAGEWDAEPEERKGECDFGEAYASCRKRAACEHVTGGKAQDQHRNCDGGTECHQRSPQAEDLPEPVRRDADECDPVIARSQEQKP